MQHHRIRNFDPVLGVVCVCVCVCVRTKSLKPGRVSQLVSCLATDASLTADPGVASSIPDRSHTFDEIAH